ncbi:hypothetical protein P5673_014454 [Acropora cervicornis]|uniref:Uncharacterized protein n=1 Tax=Acropora cervicornis TaxID=6130 RepID=A0AAD9QK70_ACRCE|nr:hypothetical protein P5673_014454 [Acropora cervicornis]
MMEGFKMMEAKVAELNAKIRPSCEVSPSTSSPTSSAKKRKTARHPDLSGKAVLENEGAGKENPNEERFNGITKEALVRSLDDSSDMKTAIETLAKQLFTSNELHQSLAFSATKIMKQGQA